MRYRLCDYAPHKFVLNTDSDTDIKDKSSGGTKTGLHVINKLTSRDTAATCLRCGLSLTMTLLLEIHGGVWRRKNVENWLHVVK